VGGKVTDPAAEFSALEGTSRTPAGDQIRLAELVAALSLAADLASGVTLEHGLRTCLLATRLAVRAGLGPADCREVYYVALLRAIGCTSDSAEQAALFGDEIAARTELNLAAHLPPREVLSVLIRHASAGAAGGRGASPARRAAAVGRALAAGPKLPRAVATAHCAAAERLGARFGLAGGVPVALGALFERWDGKGFPAGRRGTDIPAAARFTQVAYDALLLHEHFGDGTDGGDSTDSTDGGDGAAAVRRVAAAAGTLYDPGIAALLSPADVAGTAGLPDPWDAALAAEPGGPTPLSGEQLDQACQAAADFADLKSPWLLGHSRAVAELAEAAAWRAGLPAGEVARLRRAALLHDLGRVAVPSGVWNRPGPLRAAEWEQARLHPYHTERALSRSPRLAPLGALAGAHHERLDGSGYHRGVKATQLTDAARLLAAADCYQGRTEARPHRAALSPETAATELEAQVRAGRLDAAAVQAVLAAAGQRSRGGPAGPGPAARPVLPGGLSPREAQVLSLLARGQSSRQIAAQLGITQKTAGHHIQHIYAKLGVSTRATAALFALEHGLLRA
jgi:HD-GYP domain-containing protein (c-di-GMP phosphodiesterase class II)/DNA-binding CsgD family transcriptional regulator